MTETDRCETDGCQIDGPKTDRRETDGPKSDGPKTDGPKTDGPRTVTDDARWVTPTRAHTHPFRPYRPPVVEPADGLRRGRELLAHLKTRRSVRFFRSDPVPQEMIELAVAAANTAPSGAHQQPWTFVATSSPAVKSAIRAAAEKEERAFYSEREVPAWRAELDRLETDADKEFLDTAPWVVVAFAQKSTPTETGPRKNYYVNESVGIACGLFITALHTMGLATLTHTPSPMGFLTAILDRPSTERPFILFPVGYSAWDAEVPDLARKPLSEALVLCPSR